MFGNRFVCHKCCLIGYPTTNVTSKLYAADVICKAHILSFMSWDLDIGLNYTSLSKYVFGFFVVIFVSHKDCPFFFQAIHQWSTFIVNKVIFRWRRDTKKRILECCVYIVHKETSNNKSSQIYFLISQLISKKRFVSHLSL